MKPREHLPTDAAFRGIHGEVVAVLKTARGAVAHGVPYLLTWNFRQIAHAETRCVLGGICTRAGYVFPRFAPSMNCCKEPRYRR